MPLFFSLILRWQDEKQFCAVNNILSNILNPLNNFDSFSFLYFATIYLGGKYEKYRNTYER